MSRDHSFPQYAEFWAEPRNLPVSVEFLLFRGILRNSVIAGGIGKNSAYFGQVQAAVENSLLHVDMGAPLNTWLPA